MNEFQRQLRVLRNQVKRWTDEAFAEKTPKRKGPNIKMCPTCGRFADANATECSYCDTLLNPKPQATVTADGQAIQTISPVLIIFLLCTALYMGSVMMSYERTGDSFFSCLWSPSRVFYDLGATFGFYNFLTGELWRFVTAGFLHGGVLHIFFNMSWLASLGPMILDVFGNRRFWLITFGTVIGGSMISAVIGFLLFLINIQPHPSLGFSGAIFGYMAAMYIYFRQNGMVTKAAQFKSWIIWGQVTCIVLTYAGVFAVDNIGHFGGMLAGLGIASLFNKRLYVKLGENFERAIILACWALYAWGLFSIGMAIQQGTTYGA